MTGTMTLANKIPDHMTNSILVPITDWSGLLGVREEEVDRSASRPWLVFESAVGLEKSTSHATGFIATSWEVAFIPRTALGRKLYALRAEAIAEGMDLLTEDEVLEEKKRRRGELDD